MHSANTPNTDSAASAGLPAVGRAFSLDQCELTGEHVSIAFNAFDEDGEGAILDAWDRRRVERAAAAAGAREQRAAADASPLSSAALRGLHPASNTGCVKPSPSDTDSKTQVVEFHLDYLSLTVFASGAEDVHELGERLGCIIGRLWERFAPTPPAWFDRGAAAHWSSIVCGPPGVSIKCPRDPDAAYVCIELKGEAFTWLMSEDVLSLAAELDLAKMEGLVKRYHATRVDLAFDHVGIDPQTMQEWFDGGCCKSRGVPENQWYSNAEGQTCYIRSGPRVLRLYNRRGYNRLELELKEQYARECLDALLGLPCSAWAAHAVGRIRPLADFVDRSSSDRISRCSLLPAWASLVGDVNPVRLLPRKRPDINSTPAGKMNSKLARVRRALFVLRSACSTPEEFHRIIDHAAERYRLEKHQENKGRDAVEVEGLRAWLSFVDGHTDPRELLDVDAMLAELSEDPDSPGGSATSPPPF